MLGGREPAVDAQLHHGHIGVGEHVAEHAPCAVVEPPVAPERGAPLPEEPCHAAREPRVARRAVPDRVERLREAAEVVEGRRQLVRGEERTGHAPVRRDGEDGLRAREERRERPEPLAPEVVVDGVHRRTVPDEEDGHASCGCPAGTFHGGSPFAGERCAFMMPANCAAARQLSRGARRVGVAARTRPRTPSERMTCIRAPVTARRSVARGTWRSVRTRRKGRAAPPR